MQKLQITCAFIFITYTTVRAQTVEQVYEIEKDFIQCSDTGKYVRFECSQVYYTRMDSMLNATYKNLMKTLPAKERSNLKVEQRQWLKKREKFDKNLEQQWLRDVGPGYGTEINGIEGDYIKSRVITLIKRRNK